MQLLASIVAFAARVLAGFRANQGFLLAGGVAYYTLLSILPLMILMLIALSHFVGEAILLATLRRYVALVVLPGQAEEVVAAAAEFLANRAVIGWVLMLTLIFFSSLAFTVLENAMSVIFHHRVAIRRRHFLVSALLPYCYIMLLSVGILVVTLVAGALETYGAESIELFGRTWSLGGASGVLLYLLGIAGEVLVLTSIYMVMPVGRLRLSHALMGGATATALWELTRRLLILYFTTLSEVRVIYGALATAIVALASLEIMAMVLLLGAQVIAEYDRGLRVRRRAQKPFTTN